MKRYLFVILIWLWLTLALLALFISRIQPFHFLDSNALVLFIESSKLFFIIILFPLIINGECRINPTATNNSSGAIYRTFIIFLILSLPLTIMASHLGNADLGILLRANLLLLLITVFISLLSFRCSLIYYLAIFLLYGVGPILYYLVLELAGASWRFLVLLNPFWLFWQANNPEVFYSDWLVQCLVWVTLIIIIATIYRIIKKAA